MNAVAPINLASDANVETRLEKRRAYYAGVLATLYARDGEDIKGQLDWMTDALAVADVFGPNAFSTNIGMVRDDPVLRHAFGYRKFPHSDVHRHLNLPDDARKTEYEKLKTGIEAMGLDLSK